MESLLSLAPSSCIPHAMIKTMTEMVELRWAPSKSTDVALCSVSLTLQPTGRDSRTSALRHWKPPCLAQPISPPGHSLQCQTYPQMSQDIEFSLLLQFRRSLEFSKSRISPYLSMVGAPSKGVEKCSCTNFFLNSNHQFWRYSDFSLQIGCWIPEPQFPHLCIQV